MNISINRCVGSLSFSSACSDPTADTAIKLTEVGIYTFTAVSYTEQEGPRVLKPGGHGSIPSESLYYAVMESDSGDYRFYEPMESMNAAMCAVNGNFGIVSPLSLKIQILSSMFVIGFA